METLEAVNALAALAHQSRLAIFRTLVEAGPRGLAAGAIGEQLKLPPATLSFHLANLTNAGLIGSHQDGRFVIYSTDFENMNALVAFLTDNCCSGSACGPASCSPVRTNRSSRKRATEKA